MHSILLVDDEPQILAAWSLILVNEGYRVTCASNGIEALECLKHQVPDLIVTDWIMPLMDGLSLSREVRSQPDLAHIPILGHSAVAATRRSPSRLESLLEEASSRVTFSYNCA